MRDLTPFINRLKKNDRHTSKLARRMATDCWRVYDRDLPEFPVAVDRYGDWLHIAEYDTGWQQDDETREIWAEGVKAACAEALSVPFEQIAFKTRQRQKGLAQYEKTVQTAFREVADVLADRDQWGARLGAQNGVVHTAQKVQALSEARFDAGADDFLTVLDARRSLYAAQQMQISLQLAEQQNRITLWKVLGGQALPAE